MIIWSPALCYNIVPFIQGALIFILFVVLSKQVILHISIHTSQAFSLLRAPNDMTFNPRMEGEGLEDFGHTMPGMDNVTLCMQYTVMCHYI